MLLSGKPSVVLVRHGTYFLRSSSHKVIDSPSQRPLEFLTLSRDILLAALLHTTPFPNPVRPPAPRLSLCLEGFFAFSETTTSHPGTQRVHFLPDDCGRCRTLSRSACKQRPSCGAIPVSFNQRPMATSSSRAQLHDWRRASQPWP